MTQSASDWDRVPRPIGRSACPQTSFVDQGRDDQGRDDKLPVCKHMFTYSVLIQRCLVKV
jgi:hypothetical protein